MTDQTHNDDKSRRQIEPGTNRPVEPGLNRRAMIAGVGTALTTAALGAAIVPAVAVEPVDADTQGLTGLTLAAVHIERAIAAMGPVTMGKWSVKIYSGQPDQYWGFHQETNMVRRAISLHQRADKAVTEALDRRNEAEARMEANPRYESRPRVQVGKYVSMGGNPERPIYAYDLAEVDQHSEQWQGVGTSLNRPHEAEAYKAKFARLRDDLERQIKRKKRIEQRTGFTAADRALSAAWRAEEHAAMAVLLCRPANATEAAEKRAYMRGKTCFEVAYWDVDALFNAVKGNLEGLSA